MEVEEVHMVEKRYLNMLPSGKSDLSKDTWKPHTGLSEVNAFFLMCHSTYRSTTLTWSCLRTGKNFLYDVVREAAP